MIAVTVCPSDVPNCSGLLDVNLTLVVELALFLLTCWVLWVLVWRPIVTVLDARDERLAAGQLAAEEAERIHAKGLADVQAELEGGRVKARDAVANAYRDANAAAEAVRAQAQAQARASTDAALAEIGAESDAAVASLRGQAQTLAVTAASQLLHTNLDEARYAPVAAQAVAE